MHIEAPEAFRLWLTSVLGPLCDADPAALARYVHALVRKDKPINELKDTMIDQLDVFLQKETESFVALLFKTIDSKEYMSYKKDEVAADEKKEEPSSSIEATAIPPEEPKEKDDPITSTEEKTTTQIQYSVVSEGLTKDDANKVDKPEEKKKENERDDRIRLNRSRLKRDGPGYIGRSRSRSWDRMRRSRSRERLDRLEPRDRDRERDRDRRARNYRKSPIRRYERRRSYTSRSPSPGRHRPGSRSKSRSPKGSRWFRNRSPGHSRSRSRSRSHDSFDRKRSPFGLDGVKKDGEGRVGPGGHGLVTGYTGRRCRDYDVRGVCLRGDLCPYDHGTDPVVVKDLPTDMPLTYGPGGMVPGGPPMGVPHPGLMPPNGPPPHLMLQPPPPLLMRPPPNIEYSPDAPGLNPSMNWSRLPFQGRGPRGMMPGPGYHPNQRELISVPMDGYHGNNHHMDGKNRSNCCLDIRKIPAPLNNITHLNNHFAKFGKIVNIQVNYNNDPEAAMITFSSPSEANSAYKSTEAVLNNRFIKVFWHSDNPRGNGNVKERLGPQSGNVTINTATSLVKKPSVAVVDPLKREKAVEDQKAKVLQELKTKQELVEKNQTIRKKTEETRKEALELSTELKKRAQLLRDKQMEQLKELLDKYCKGGLDDKQKAAIKEAAKILQDSIDKLNKELTQIVKDPKKPVIRTKEEIQKEILDTELDIISKQQEGGDLVPLQKKLGLLRIELLKLHPILPSVPPRPKATATSIHKYPAPYTAHSFVRKSFSKVNYKTTVDIRPTKLLVSGYENDDKEMVLAHFKEFGEIADYIADDSTPSIVLNFKTRQEAEAAMNKGKNFQDRTLSITWFNTPQMPARRRNSSAGGPTYHMHAGRQVLLSGSEPELESDSVVDNDEETEQTHTEDFLLPDDDDEGDDEERSWRR